MVRARKVSNIKTLNDQETIAIEELISKVRAAFQVKNVILFGSKARGDSNENSDVNIRYQDSLNEQNKGKEK